MLNAHCSLDINMIKYSTFVFNAKNSTIVCTSFNWWDDPFITNALEIRNSKIQDMYINMTLSELAEKIKDKYGALSYSTLKLSDYELDVLSLGCSLERKDILSRHLPELFI